MGSLSAFVAFSLAPEVESAACWRETSSLVTSLEAEWKPLETLDDDCARRWDR